jgi:PAS domain S-box-containing protein
MPALVRTVLAISVLMLQPLATVRAQQSGKPKRVLVLYWYNRDYPGNISYDNYFQAALKSAAPGPTEYYPEYLESNRFPGEDQSVLLRDYLKQKYADLPPDVIVTTTPAALEFLTKYRSHLFPNSPIVFSTVEFPAPEEIQSGAGATGIVYAKTHGKTLDLALRLHPGTEQVFVICGTREFEETARSELQRYERRVLLHYLTGLSLQELMLRMKSLPERSIVLYVRQYFRDSVGNALGPQNVLALFASHTDVPIYGLSEMNVGLGVVGGYVWTVEGNAVKAVEITVRILKGARAADIPVQKAPDVPMFDWRQLQRWDIREDRLPPRSIVLFREFSFWQKYKLRIIVVLVAFAFQTALIGALLIERRRVSKGAAALRRAQRVLQESEERFRNMANTAPVMLWVSGPDKRRVFFNKGWLDFTGRTIEQELVSEWIEGVHPDDRDRYSATYDSSLDARIPFQFEYRRKRADGEYRSLLCTVVPRFQDGDIFVGYIASCLDITDLKHSQEKSLAGQKLESMGLLASGIAHDFNNLLGGVLASAELALAAHDEGTSHVDELLRIKAAAIGGAEIVRQLMAYGGKQSEESEPVECAGIIREMLQLLRISIAKNAILKTDLDNTASTVQGNPAQIRQLVMNLVINASDAIGEKEGEIRVTTRVLPAQSCAPVVTAAKLPVGAYMEIQVADTGKGMTEETKAKIFDPFFTTKPAGRGLGLAVVQGVVRAHGGLILVKSEPGRGTSFQVLLPCMAKDKLASVNSAPIRTGVESRCESGTVLFIEDEDTLRLAVTKMLRKRGFRVLDAPDGYVGMDLFQANTSVVDIVLLDMTLPGKSGPEIYGELQNIRPDVKVIITSAYSRDRVQASLLGLRPLAFVQKPYRLDDLVQLLRDSTAQTRAYGLSEC